MAGLHDAQISKERQALQREQEEQSLEESAMQPPSPEGSSIPSDSEPPSPPPLRQPTGSPLSSGQHHISYTYYSQVRFPAPLGSLSLQRFACYPGLSCGAQSPLLLLLPPSPAP